MANVFLGELLDILDNLESLLWAYFLEAIELILQSESLACLIRMRAWNMAHTRRHVAGVQYSLCSSECLLKKGWWCMLFDVFGSGCRRGRESCEIDVV